MRTELIDSLADVLTRKLASGLAVSSETLFFAESTYGQSVEEFCGTLQNQECEERDLFLELIFFPDQHTRRLVESKLADEPLSGPEVQELSVRLDASLQKVRLYIDNVHSPVEVTVDQHILSHLVGKLYLNRKLHPEVCAALAEGYAEETELDARILMRLRNNKLSGDAADLLLRFVVNAAERTASFLPLFDLCLKLLAEAPANMSPASHLIRQRQALINSFKEIREFEKRKDQYGMEYLLMQRYQVPCESEEVVLKTLEHLTLITDVILELPRERTEPVLSHDLGSYNSAEDMERLIRILS